MRSGCSLAAHIRTARRIAGITTFISYVANAAPRQRRTPPPNGIHEYVSAGRSMNRSGRNRSGSG
jgi:hypothetical protein